MTDLLPIAPAKILVVEDDKVTRSLLLMALQEDGYDLAEATSGEACLEIFSQWQPDMVLLDAVMPKMDGFECCQRLRTLPDGQTLPILMITFLDDRESIEKAFHAGATDYITKPIHWFYLRQRIRQMVTATALQRRIEDLTVWEQTIYQTLHQWAQESRPSAIAEFLAPWVKPFRCEGLGFIHRETGAIAEPLDQTFLTDCAPESLAALKAFLPSILPPDPLVWDATHPVLLPPAVQALFTRDRPSEVLIQPVTAAGVHWGWLWIQRPAGPQGWQMHEQQRCLAIADGLGLGLAQGWF